MVSCDGLITRPRSPAVCEKWLRNWIRGLDPEWTEEPLKKKLYAFTKMKYLRQAWVRSAAMWMLTVFAELDFIRILNGSDDGVQYSELLGFTVSRIPDDGQSATPSNSEYILCYYISRYSFSDNGCLGYGHLCF
jgi:hypothetical protein